MKLILQAIKALFRKLEAAIEGVKLWCVQGDWTQNDPEAPDYMRGRTHYEEVKHIPIEGMEFIISSLHDNTNEYEHGLDIPLEVGQTWQVYYTRDGSTWSTVPSATNGLEEVVEAEDGTLYIGTYGLSECPCYITSTIYRTNSTWVKIAGVVKLKIVGISGTYVEKEVHKLDEKYIPRPDWNASEGEPGHILNRTHYKGVAELVNGMALWNDDMNGMTLESYSQLTVGETYTVTYNGVDYTCTAFAFASGGMTFSIIGNGAGLGLEDTGEPFSMYIMDGMLACMDYSGATEATIRIVGEKVFPMPYEYLPPLSYVIDVEDVTTSSGNKFANMIYDTTELVQFLKNGWPVWLNITGGSIDKRVQVTAWSTLGVSIDEQIAQGVSPAAVVLFLCGKELGLATEYKWTLQLNTSD